MEEDDSQIPARSASLWPLQVSTFVLKPTAKNVQHRKLKTPKTQILAGKAHTQNKWNNIRLSAQSSAFWFLLMKSFHYCSPGEQKEIVSGSREHMPEVLTFYRRFRTDGEFRSFGS
jgi:hypothetical protein